MSNLQHMPAFAGAPGQRFLPLRVQCMLARRFMLDRLCTTLCLYTLISIGPQVCTQNRVSTWVLLMRVRPGIRRRHGLCVADLRHTQHLQAQRIQPAAALSDRSGSGSDRISHVVASMSERNGSVRAAASATIANPPSADTETPAAKVRSCRF